MESQICCEIECMEVAPLAEEALFRLWLDRMPEIRRRKVASLRFAEGRRLSLGAGILLFRALEKRGLDGARTEIRENEFGQPCFPDHLDLHFSLSHAGTWAMCAVSGAPVGCDAERLGRGNGRLARYCLTPEELETLERKKDPGEWDREFTRFWTRKESYLKATGRGMSLRMSSFSVLPGEEGRWFEERPMAEGYVFSVCGLGRKTGSTVWRRVRLEDDPEGKPSADAHAAAVGPDTP